MKLALFTNGYESLAATSSGQPSVFESSLIFQDPDLFTARFLFQMQNRFGINDFSQVEHLIIALTGLMDTENNQIIRSNLINDVSRIKIYDGFNFNDALYGNIKKEQIFVLNDAFAMALGVSQQHNKTALPCMVLSLDDGIGVGFISPSNSISTREWGGDFVPSMNKDIWKALGREGINRLLHSKKIDINTEYTAFLVHAINYLANKYAENNTPVKSIFILGKRTQYVDEKQLKGNLGHLQISMVTDETSKEKIILDGCFAYPDYVLKPKNKVTKIQYFSGQELIYDFEDFKKCATHFISVKPISDPDNYYKIFYSDGSVTTIAMGKLNDISELELYEF